MDRNFNDDSFFFFFFIDKLRFKIFKINFLQGIQKRFIKPTFFKKNENYLHPLKCRSISLFGNEKLCVCVCAYICALIYLVQDLSS